MSRLKSILLDVSTLHNFILVVLFSLLTAVGSLVEIPLGFTPIPLTLQTLFVSLAGATLGAKRGAISQLVFLAYGLCGLPVFAGGASGMAQLLGPTGGYLIGFPIAAWLTGVLVSERHNFIYNLGAFFLASLPILIIGSLQLELFTGHDMATAFALGFVPFLAGDFIKCTTAAMIHKGLRSVRSK